MMILKANSTLRFSLVLSAFFFLGACPVQSVNDAGSVSPDAGSVSPDAGTVSPDAGTVSPDAGTVSPDAGTVSPDAGAVSPDAGAVSPDAGAVSPDAGAVSPDAGTASLDAGTVSSDAGAVSLDAGTVSPDAGTVSPDAGTVSPDAGVVDAGPATFASCFADLNEAVLADYASMSPVLGSHCDGTNHQDFTGVERVVFVGDSVTAGTPPTTTNEYFRNVVADGLASRLNLAAASDAWKRVNVFDSGKGTALFAGDFANCSEWGDRTRDLTGAGSQLERCFPTEERSKNTLIIGTLGGNDLKRIAERSTEEPRVPDEELWLMADEMLAELEAGYAWLFDENNLSGEVKMVLANVYEYTDGTGTLLSCPLASAGGSFVNFAGNPQDPALLMAVLNYINEGYMRMAVARGVDMVFMREQFCGHGFERENAEIPCFRAQPAVNYFDATCIHPTPEGHARLAEAILNVIDE